MPNKVWKQILLLFSYFYAMFCQTQAPIDLYLAFDQSGSLSEAKFTQLVDFGEALAIGVGKITGFYQRTSNGLRVGAVTFGCGKQTRERLLPTGDQTIITDSMDNMRKYVKTYGETCLEPALQLLLGFKESQKYISPLRRSTALVVLSDGRFDDFDAWQDEISLFMDNVSQGFSVGIGDKVRESEMISIADNNPDKYFHLQNPDALTTLIELIASMVINDFHVDILVTETGVPINSGDELCVGQSISAQVIGNSLQVFSSFSETTCDFVYSDGTVISVLATSSLVDQGYKLICKNPDISGAYNNVTIDVRMNNNRIYSEFIEISKKPCIEINKYFEAIEVENFQNCYGGGVTQASLMFTGLSAELLSKGKELLSCQANYVTTLSGNKEVFAGEIELIPEGFNCLLDGVFFDIQKENPSSVELQVLIDTPSIGNLVAVTETLDTSLKTDCLEFDLVSVDHEGDHCLGDEMNLVISGETAANVIANLEQGKVDIHNCSISNGNYENAYTFAQFSFDPVKNYLQCKLPYTYGLQVYSSFEVNFNLQFSTGRNDVLSVSVSNYTLNNCFSGGYPKKFVIQSTNGERIENGRFCAGDRYDIEFAGDTIDKLIDISSSSQLSLYCDFYKNGITETVLLREPALQRSDNVVTCSPLIWSPYDPDLADYFDFSEVRLVVLDNVMNMIARPIVINIFTGNSLCFDNPDHQVPTGFEPSEAIFGNRYLQESCYPFCCKRPSVSIGFSGRTIAVISEAQSSAGHSILRCVYTATDSSQVITNVSLQGSHASCAPAPGWRLRGNTGDYVSVQLELYEESGNIRNFSRFDYSPSTGSTTCVNNIPQSYYCFGESIAFKSYGLTLLALLEDDTLIYNDDLFTISLDNEEMHVTVIEDEKHTVWSKWKSFDSNRIISEAVFQINIEDILLDRQTISDITIENLDRCLGIADATTTCRGILETESLFNSSISGSGDALIFYPPSKGTYACIFYSTDSNITTTFKVPAAVDINSNAVTCSLLGDSPYSDYQITYTNQTDNKEIILRQGTMAISNLDCTDPIEGGDKNPPGSSDPPVAYFIPIALIVLFTITLIFFIYKRGKQSNKQISKKSKEQDQIFSIGENVSVHVKVDKIPGDTIKYLNEKSITPEHGGFWFKGTITEKTAFELSSSESSIVNDLENGESTFFLYDVALASSIVTFGEIKQVRASSIRSESNCFKVGDIVEYVEDTQKYHVNKILPNDKYVISEEFLSTELIVDAYSLKLAKEMSFKKGDIVFFNSDKSKQYLATGKISIVDQIEQNYSIINLDSNETFVVSQEYVYHASFNAGNVVQIRLSENPEDAWKRAIIVKQVDQTTYQVRLGSKKEQDMRILDIKDIRYPKFAINSKVEVLEEQHMADNDNTSNNLENWEPGIIKLVNKDTATYKVFLTRKNQLTTAAVTHLRNVEMDEVIKRIRLGLPLRSSNLDTSVYSSSSDLLPFEKRFRTRKPLDFIELPNHQFDITVDPSDGLGVKFGWTDDRVIVAGFKDMKNGDWGVLEATGLVMVKDQLIQINGLLVANYGISDISDLIEKSKHEKKITLRFGRNNMN